ncbi:hypothetical protein Vretimale_17550 [Volvox reticuliferus]|uniref:Uncharacterized protein n=1 Tax=Volvox reticuliferus TaxID=1737510 RepID=A0A8J4C7L7_9CHLO|nr:hypothetical protein Vretifemale_3442 [Volvox reticuliferus]GIM14754.1 hypothetical protein Vretimale_17550 [Volvox reticuliferus]
MKRFQFNSIKATWWPLACCLPMLVGLLLAATPTVMGDDGVSGGTVACEHYVIITKSSNLASIAATFSTTVAGVHELNPAWFNEADLDEPGAGVPLCVIGTVLPDTTTKPAAASGRVAAESKRLGKRPQSIIAFTTIPGVHTCYEIFMNANPPIDFHTFVAMNPTLDCANMSSTASTVYLPKGTKIGKKPPTTAAQTAAADKDCIFGQWGDWMGCSPDGTKTRFRNIFQQASGSGVPCPPAVETMPCNTTEQQQGHPMRRLMLTTHDCPAGYDGCRVPANLQYYHLFVPSCNLHGICYSCNRHKGWEFASKSYCDKDVYYNKMLVACNSYYWSSSTSVYNLIWCNMMANGYYTAFVIAGQSFYDLENTSKVGRLDDGCHWKPWDPQVNNINSGFHPGFAGCPCNGTSCTYGPYVS